MKKRSKGKRSSVPLQDEPYLTGLIVKMQQQLSFLEKKMDILIGQAQEKPFQMEHHPKPFRRHDYPQRQRDGGQDNNFRERVLHKAVCADCGNECEVPFKPSQDRPVYCRNCFSKRKSGDSPKENPHKKFFGKKRASGKPRKNTRD